MRCTDYIIFVNRIAALSMHSDRDVPKKYVPKTQWLNPLRYQVVILPASCGGRHIVINRSGVANRIVSDFLYKHIRPKMCKYLKIHQRFSFKGGDKQCHHCAIGRDVI